MSVENTPDFTPGAWAELSQPELEDSSLELQARWYEYLRQRIDNYSRESLTASKTGELFEAPLGELTGALEVFRGCLIEGSYNRPYFYDLNTDADIPRRVNFLGGGGLRYAKQFRGVLGGIVASDVRWDREDDVQPGLFLEVRDDLLLMAVGPANRSSTDSQRSFASRKDALMYSHPFGIKQYAGSIAFLELESIVQLGVNSGARVDFRRPQE